MRKNKIRNLVNIINIRGEKMKKVLKIFSFMYFFSCWWIILSIDAQAYIDPSAVTYVIQAVVAVFIAIGAVITVFRHKIIAFLKKGSKKNNKREIHLREDADDNKDE